MSIVRVITFRLIIEIDTYSNSAPDVCARVAQHLPSDDEEGSDSESRLGTLEGRRKSKSTSSSQTRHSTASTPNTPARTVAEPNPELQPKPKKGQLSEYELTRLANIEKNKQLLRDIDKALEARNDGGPLPPLPPAQKTTGKKSRKSRALPQTKNPRRGRSAGNL